MKEYQTLTKLHLGDNTLFCTFEELDNIAHFLAIGHLILDLIDSIKE